MARIKTYKLDDNVTGSDMWIGTDGNDASKTKNFSPTYLANYLNQNEVIDIANSIRFTYDTIDSGKNRKSGTLSFATEIGAIVPINSLTTFILSKNTQSTKLVNAFLNILPGTKIILQKSDYINIFGIFKVVSVTQITLEPDFYTVVVEYISGYGSLEEDKDYIISLIDLQGAGDVVPTRTSDLINDGEDGVNPFITLEDLPSSASTLQEVTDNGNTTSNDIIVENTDYYSIVEPSDVGTQNKNTNAYTYIGADGVIGIKTGTFEGEIKTTDLTAGITLEFPDKVAGTYTIATTDDVSATPSLNEVLVVDNQTLGTNIKVNNADAIELENGSLLRKGTYDFGGFGDVIVNGITNSGDGYIAGVMGWGDPSGTLWSDLNGTYIKTSIAVTPSAYFGGDIGMHTPEPGTFNYYLENPISMGSPNSAWNGVAYFLAPGNKSGWGDPDNDATTDTPVNYWRLCVLSDYPYVYFTNPSSDPYNFPTSGWVPIDDTIPNSEGGNGYDYIADYGGGFTASISNTLNGDGGISRICSIGYEDMWQAGVRYVFGNSGTIRHATNGFTVIPDSSFDYTKRFAIGSLWTLDNGDTYECTNVDLNAAVWELVNTGKTPNLQQVTDEGNTVTSGNYLSMVAANMIEVVNVITGTGSAITPDDGVLIKTGIYQSNVKTDDLTVDRIHQLPDADGTLALTTDVTNKVPYTGATEDVNLGLFDITAAHIIKDGGQPEQFLKADGSVDNNVYLTSADLPATLDLYATTTASDILGYTVLVRNISDIRYNTTAVDVSTGSITTTVQLVGSLVTDANIISGNPGVFNITTIGNISRTAGTGQAEFYFRIYKRTSAGVETLITESDKTLPVTNGGYSEFSATALWNDGVFLDTDRVVIKYYADRLTSPVGSNPTYNFQFGGISPVRSSAAIPTSVMPNIYLRDLADVENVDALNNEILYWNDVDSLWEHSLAEDLVPDATATQRGLVSTGTQTIAGAKTFSSNLIMPATGIARLLQVEASGQISGLDLLVYPSLAELETVKGITTGVTIQSQLDLKQPYAVATTGYVISFVVPQIYNDPTITSSSDITNSLGSAKIGVVQKIYHNKTVAPTFPAGWVKLGTGVYTVSVLNIIYAEWVSGSRVEYWIVKA